MSAFPPSSPFLEHAEHDVDDPFSSFSGRSSEPKKLVINTPFSKSSSKQHDRSYPTPNPSSSTGGRSSSPARQELHELATIERTSSCVSERQDALASPLASPATLNVLVYPREKVSIGRSSRCDYFLKSKFASREHMKLYYDAAPNELTILCKGHNGVIIHFGKTQYGYVTEDKGQIFEFHTISKQEASAEDDEIFEELPLMKGEQITVPYSKEITLEVKGSLVSVEITNDESETEDEMPVLSKTLTSFDAEEQTKKTHDSEGPKNPISAVTPKDTLSSTLQTPMNKPIKPSEMAPVKHLSRSCTPILKSSVSFEDSDSTNSKEVGPDRAKSAEPEVFIRHTESKAHKRSASTEMKHEQRAALLPKSESSLNKQANRRRKAEPGNSPQKKKLDTKVPQETPRAPQQPKEKIENLNLTEILAGIEGIPALQNLLSNHLAFSRLSQTPLNQLQSISALTQALTRRQLRAVLASTECIGVIYRHGKDAAGKYLDEEYYYDVEKDEDASRVQLVSSIKGSSGLRNCRKTHKQYFWKKPVSRK